MTARAGARLDQAVGRDRSTDASSYPAVMLVDGHKPAPSCCSNRLHRLGSTLLGATAPHRCRRALDLVASGRTVVEVADLLGIAQSCLYGRKSRDLVERGVRPARPPPSLRSWPPRRPGSMTWRRRTKILRKAAAAVEAVVAPKRPMSPRRGPGC